LNPNLPQAYNGLGYAYRKLGDYAKALENYDRALQLSPRFVDAIEYRGGPTSRSTASMTQSSRISRSLQWTGHPSFRQWHVCLCDLPSAVSRVHGWPSAGDRFDGRRPRTKHDDAGPQHRDDRTVHA
jgi:tetratricopeptide (TPR) repeat protein